MEMTMLATDGIDESPEAQLPRRRVGGAGIYGSPSRV